jgi:hypothetical protein
MTRDQRTQQLQQRLYTARDAFCEALLTLAHHQQGYYPFPPKPTIAHIKHHARLAIGGWVPKCRSKKGASR